MKIESYSFPPFLNNHKKDLMKIENKCFHPNLQEPWSNKLTLIIDSQICLFVFDKSRNIVGECYSLDFKNKYHFGETDCYWRGLRKLYSRRKTIYVYSFAVLERYRKQGIGKNLIRSTIAIAKHKGYSFLIAHVKDGSAVKIFQELGAKILHHNNDWSGTGATHRFCEIKLK